MGSSGVFVADDSSSSTGVIVGAIIGVIAVTILTIVLIIAYKRGFFSRCSKSNDNDSFKLIDDSTTSSDYEM